MLAKKNDGGQEPEGKALLHQTQEDDKSFFSNVALKRPDQNHDQNEHKDQYQCQRQNHHHQHKGMLDEWIPVTMCCPQVCYSTFISISYKVLSSLKVFPSPKEIIYI